MATTQAVSFTKIVTTDTTANSLIVGGATPSATAGTGGIKCGPIVNTTLNASGTSTLVAVTMSGALTNTQLGTSSFTAGGNSNNQLRVENTSAGTGAIASMNLRNDGTFNGGFRVLSSTFSTSGPDIADALSVHWNGPAGITIAATNATGPIKFYTGGNVLAGTISTGQVWSFPSGFTTAAASTVTGSGASTAFTVATTTNSNATQTFANASTGTLAQIIGTNALGLQLNVNAGNSFGIEIDVAGLLRLRGYGAGTLTTDGSGNVTAVSDERVKDITGMFTTGLDAVLALDPILFHYTPESGLDTVGLYAGFSAQNVETSIPEAVSLDPRGYRSLNVIPIIAALVNAVKSLQVQVDGLKGNA